MTKQNLESVEAVYTKWSALAADVEPSTSTVPIIVLLGEAHDLAETVARRWEPSAGTKPLPGLKSAVATGVIPETLAADLRELAGAVTRALGEYRAVNENTLAAPVERGEFLLAEMRQCLQFIFDDGTDDEADAALVRLNESHNDTSTHDALAMSLEGFAIFASRHRERLAILPEFDVAMLDEAVAVAARLRDQSALKLSGVIADRQRTALEERNRLITLLTDRMNRARRAFRFVFRNHLEIAKLAGSSYERNRRAARRRADDGAADTIGEGSGNAATTAAPVAAPAPTATPSTGGARSTPLTA